jgi:hypothetical protein
MTLAGLAGAFVALFVVSVTVPQGRLIVDLTAILLGALGAIGIDRYFRG